MGDHLVGVAVAAGDLGVGQRGAGEAVGDAHEAGAATELAAVDVVDDPRAGVAPADRHLAAAGGRGQGRDDRRCVSSPESLRSVAQR